MWRRAHRLVPLGPAACRGGGATPQLGYGQHRSCQLLSRYPLHQQHQHCDYLRSTHPEIHTLANCFRRFPVPVVGGGAGRDPNTAAGSAVSSRIASNAAPKRLFSTHSCVYAGSADGGGGGGGSDGVEPKQASKWRVQMLQHEEEENLDSDGSTTSTAATATASREDAGSDAAAALAVAKISPVPHPGSLWEEILQRIGAAAGEGKAVSVTEYSSAGPPKPPSKQRKGGGKSSTWSTKEVRVASGLVSKKPTLIGMCNADIDARVDKLVAGAGLSQLDAVRIALGLPFVHVLDFPESFATVVQLLQNANVDVPTVVMDQPFIFTVDPELLAARLDALETAGILKSDVGEVVTRQPSLLALPVDPELFARPAALMKVEVGPESAAYSEVKSALCTRKQLRRWDNAEEEEAADVAEFLSTFATRGTDVAKALPHLQSTPLEEMEEKITWLQRQPLSLSWAEVSRLVIKQAATFALFNVEQALENVQLANKLLQAANAAGVPTPTVGAVLGRAPKLLTSRTLTRDVEGLTALGLTPATLGQVVGLHGPALTSGGFAWRNMWPRVDLLHQLYSEQDVVALLNKAGAQVLRVDQGLITMRIGAMLRARDANNTNALPPSLAGRDAAELMAIEATAFATLLGVTPDSLRVFGAELGAELRYLKSLKSRRKTTLAAGSSNVGSGGSSEYPRVPKAAFSSYLMLPIHELRKIKLMDENSNNLGFHNTSTVMGTSRTKSKDDQAQQQQQSQSPKKKSKQDQQAHTKGDAEDSLLPEQPTSKKKKKKKQQQQQQQAKEEDPTQHHKNQQQLPEKWSKKRKGWAGKAPVEGPDISTADGKLVRKEGVYEDWVLQLSHKQRQQLSKESILPKEDLKVLAIRCRQYKQAISNMNYKKRLEGSNA